MLNKLPLLLLLALVALLLRPNDLVRAVPSPMQLPFSPSQTWYVCQGYFGTISHNNVYALDLTTDPNGVGPNGCFGDINYSSGKAVKAPASGAVVQIGATFTCLNFDAGGSMLIGHLTNRAPNGPVSAEQTIGQTSLANPANGGYAHIHVQIHLGSGCASDGPTVPFDDAHGTRFQQSPNLPD